MSTGSSPVRGIMIKTFFSYCGKNKAACWRLVGSGLLLVQFLVVPTIESTSPSVPWLFYCDFSYAIPFSNDFRMSKDSNNLCEGR